MVDSAHETPRNWHICDAVASYPLRSTIGLDPEEGEIYDSALTQASNPETENFGFSYDPVYEWPDDMELTGSSSSLSSPPTTKFRPHQPSFRLIVLRSSILPSKQKVAIIDGHSEIQFGRDVAPSGSTTPKVRLKEMEVSKLHATAYWDASRREWGIVDMGSVHGTFVHPTATTRDDRGARLSPPRQASVPRTLKHTDQLTIGGTTFLVHMHKNQRPCEECHLHGKGEIPLFPISRGLKSTVSGTRHESHLEAGYQPVKDAKTALTVLKHNLLMRHPNDLNNPRTNASVDSLTQYIDRSARRRALMPAVPSDAPGVLPTPSMSACIEASSFPRPRSEPVSQPPKPLPSSNIGHRLLMKQGWEPGTALGVEIDSNEERIGLVEPLQVSATEHRAGLGLKRGANLNTEYDWREQVKRRRWDSTR